MYKLLNLFFIIIITGFITGCSFLSNDPIEQEYNRLSSFIPKEYNEDFLLPESSEEFEVSYLLNGTKVEEKVIYTVTKEDLIQTLTLEITYQDEVQTYQLTLTSVGNETLFNQNETENYFAHAFQMIEFSLPNYIEHNFTIKEYDFSDRVIYNVDCSVIERGRIVYTFPTQDESCELEATIYYKGQTETKVFPFKMRSIYDLPQLPEVRIYTEQTVASKDFVRATLSVNPNGNVQYKPLNNIGLNIRLRGNSTLYLPKQSFKIKFDEKQKFLSPYAERDWVLLANYIDQTLIRNALAYTFAATLRLDFTPTVVFVDLYINDVYQGNYMLTDQIEVTNDRVDIEEHATSVNTGYLIEYDATIYNFGGIEASDDAYFVIDNMPFKLHSPEASDPNFNQAQLEYIEQYFIDTINALQNKQDYHQYIDEDSFVDYYIVNEIFKNVDVWYGSDYFHKDVDGLLKMGPVWDLDLSSGNPGYDSWRGPEGFYTQNKHLFYGYLFQYPEFRQAVKNRWNELYDTNIQTIVPNVLHLSDSITYSRYQNFELWNVIGIENSWYTAPELLEITEYDGLIWHLYDWLDTRIEWLDEAINDLN